MKKYTADFETATWIEDETYVWAWATCMIDENNKIEYGNNIESFMEWCKKNKNSEIYFHNEKFDGEFIISWLLNNGYKHVKNKEEIENNSFTTLISGLGQFYSITLYYKVYKNHYEKITFIDSLKIIPFSVDVIAKSFGLEISKLKIDYNLHRSRNHEMTEDEKEYIKNDVLIVAQALKILFDDNLTKMTQGSNALYDFRKIITQKTFEYEFPLLDKYTDEDIRKSYKGGFTYLSPEYAEKDVGEGVVLDVNSLYPSVMYNEYIPYSNPLKFDGKYKKDNIYDLYVQHISCAFEIKKNKLPTIQIKNNINFRGNEYLTTTKNEYGDYEIVSLTLTNIDLDLFLEHYDVFDLEYKGRLEIQI